MEASALATRSPSSPPAAAARNARWNATHSMAGMRARAGSLVRAIEERRRRLVAEAVLASRPRHVVDVGCEDGWMAEAYAPRVGRTTLVDLDPAMLERARRRAIPRADARVADAEDARALAGLSADVVLLSAVLEHVERPEAALAAAAGALAPGGRIVAYVPADGPILAAKAFLRALRLGRLLPGLSLEPAPGHVRRYDRRSFARDLARVGRVERLAFDPAVLGYLGVVRPPAEGTG
jgi:SAM-dependent methyltransferase